MGEEEEEDDDDDNEEEKNWASFWSGVGVVEDPAVAVDDRE